MEKKRERQRKRNRAGFTLIEILLVVIIIGILAAVAVPRFTGRTEQARIAAAKSSIKAIGIALDMYELDTGTYPPNLAALSTSPGSQDWKGPYLKEGLPKDPWGNTFVYAFPGSRNPGGYDLSSPGPSSGDVEINNWSGQ